MINSSKILKRKLNLEEIKIKVKELLFLSTNVIFANGQLSEKNSELIIKKQKSFYIINIIKIAKILYLAQKIILIMAKNQKKILFVSTNKSTSNFLVNNFSDLLFKNCFYITARWTGGFLTNWKNFKSKLLSLKNLENIKEKISKKEQAACKLKKEKFEKAFKGIKNLISFPDLIVFLSIANKKLAISECKKLSIPTIGLSDISKNFENFDITIPVNIQSFNSIKYIIKSFLNIILRAYKE